MDVWKQLGISPTTNQKEIKKAYAKMSIVCHPEENPEDFAKLHEAYQQALRYAKRHGVQAGMAQGSPAVGYQKNMAQKTKDSLWQNKPEGVSPGQAEEEKEQQAIPPGQAEEEKEQQAIPPGQAEEEKEQQAIPPGQAEEEKEQQAIPPGQAEEEKEQQAIPQELFAAIEKALQEQEQKISELMEETEPLFGKKCKNRRKKFQRLLSLQAYSAAKDTPRYISYLARRLEESPWISYTILLDIYESYGFPQLEQTPDKGKYLPLFSYLRPLCQNKSRKGVYMARIFLCSILILFIASAMYTKQYIRLWQFGPGAAMLAVVVTTQPKVLWQPVKRKKEFYIRFSCILAASIFATAILTILMVNGNGKKEEWIPIMDMESYLSEKYGAQFQYKEGLAEKNSDSKQYYEFSQEDGSVSFEVIVRKEGDRYFLSDTYMERAIRQYTAGFLLDFSVSQTGAEVFWFSYPGYEGIGQFADKFIECYNLLVREHPWAAETVFCFVPEDAIFPKYVLQQQDTRAILDNKETFINWLEQSYVYYQFEYEPWNLEQELQEAYQTAYLQQCVGITVQGANGKKIYPDVQTDGSGQMTIGNFYRLLAAEGIPVDKMANGFSISINGRTFLFGQGSNTAKLSLETVQDMLGGIKITAKDKQ